MVHVDTTMDYAPLFEEEAHYRGAQASGIQCDAYNNWLLPTKAQDAAGDVTSKYRSLDRGVTYAEHSAKIDALLTDSSLWPEASPAPAQDAVRTAQIVLTRCYHTGLMPNKVVSSVDGGVTLCFARGDRYSDIECINGGTVLAVTVERKRRPTVWDVEPSESGIDTACIRIKRFVKGNP